MYNIGIIGLGFLGGSLIKSLRKSNKVGKIVALDTNQASLELALSENMIDEYTMIVDDHFADLDIIYIATPVTYIAEYAKDLEKVIRKDCIITDLGSTKKSIIEAVKTIDIDFVGGHPMVGSERSGYETSKDLLFENSYYIITKGVKTSDRALQVLTELVREIHAIPIVIEENYHDYVTATISHVPHIIAASLVHLVKDLDDDNETMKTLAAGGFKDITRIASSDPTMWENISKENSEQILKVLDILLSIINEYKNNIDNRDKIFNYFKESKEYRDLFANKKINGTALYEVDVSIKDEKGALARIINILSDNNIDIRNMEIMNNRENNFGHVKIILANFEERDLAVKVLTDNNLEVSVIN